MGDELVERGLDLYRCATRALHERNAHAWLEVELSLAQLRAMFALSDGGPMPIGGVASRLGIGLPAASSLVDRLVEQGMAVRREDRLDRRRTLAQPTPAGEAMIERLRQGSRETLRTWLEGMAPADLEALVKGLSGLAEVAGLATPAGREVAVEGVGGPRRLEDVV